MICRWVFIAEGRLKGRDLVSIKDLTREDFEQIFHIAEKMKKEGYSKNLKDKIIGLLFYEPSTRTRLSFDAAARLLGAETIWFAGVEGTSVMKGETLKDTIETVANYVDLIVLRHPCDGAARWAADVTTNRMKRGHKKVPVINAGDGKNEHPTQTILDLFTIKERKGRIDGLCIAIIGDLKYGRTVHSLIYALSLYDCDIILVAPEALQIPEHIEEFMKRKNMRYEKRSKLEEIISIADILYVTRIQKERFPDENEYNKVKGIFRLNKELLSKAKSDACIMHPLPRVDEISTDVDSDYRACYFEQAANGIPIRAAIMSLILGMI
ncbi:MAG: aspartate carbamoyltransferase [Candidatus Methanomethyliaceae archaeon]|nr:aspartate carbamoyltransferase [Candidatus Methanomethyliaceae archaeon]MDW7970511.1 aspartate carbamoyltransferase [Nitrososphaerota archaeon]